MSYIDHNVINGQTYYLRDKYAIHDNEWLDIIYPVGSIFFSTSVNPNVAFGGTWRQIEDKFLLAAGDTFSAGNTGGSKDSVLVSHTHTATGSSSPAGAHTHSTTSDGYHAHDANGWAFSVYKGTRSSEDIGSISGSKWRISQVNKSGGSWGGSATTNTAGLHSHTANSAGEHSHAVQVQVNTTGEDGTNKNLPPYLVVYVWERTN